jgi:hypothetical protein
MGKNPFYVLLFVQRTGRYRAPQNQHAVDQ